MSNEIIVNESHGIQATEAGFAPTTGYVNTLDLSTDEGVLKTFGYTSDSQPLSQHIGEALKICDVFTTPGIRKGRGLGQVDTECQNTYLIDIDGVGYFSQSDGVARSINLLMAMRPNLGKDTEKGYIELVCVEKQLPNGNTLKILKPVI